MPLRRFHVLVVGLPPDSALRRQGRMWTQTHELLASIYERQDHWGSALVQMSGRVMKDGAKPPPVMQITHQDRPEREVQKKKVASLDEVARMFGGR